MQNLRGHLKVENGYYSIVLNIEINGCKKWPQWSTGLRIKGNKTLALYFLEIVSQSFHMPCNDEEYKIERKRIQTIIYDTILNENLLAKVSSTVQKKVLKYKEEKQSLQNKPSNSIVNPVLIQNRHIDLPLVPSNSSEAPMTTDCYTWVTGIAGNPTQECSLDSCYYVYRGPDLEDVKINGNTPFYEFLELYMNYIYRNEAKPNTFEKAYSIIKHRDIPYFKSLDISLYQVNVRVLNFYFEQSAKGYTLDGVQYKPLKHSSILQHHSYIKRALEFAAKISIIPNNPSDHVKLPTKRSHTSKDTYSVEELKELFRVVHGRACEYIVIMAAYYGMRRNEIIGLKWSDINFQKKFFRIRRGVHYTRVGEEFGLYISESTKSESSARTLPLFPAVEKMLRRIQKEIARNRYLFRDQYSLEYKDFIFVDHLGKLRSPETVSKSFKQLLTTHHLRYISLHNLRHTVGTLLAEENINLEKIRIWLGHSDIQTTSKYYLHANYQTQLDTAKTLEAILPDVSDEFDDEDILSYPLDESLGENINFDENKRVEAVVNSPNLNSSVQS